MRTALVVHGHFYQPPRENPWTDSIDREPGAKPFHDWNEKIHSECYRPNAHARILDNYGRVNTIVNNYAKLSFNFGPTLLSWIERQHPGTYARILDADRESIPRRGGHGNAIAQGYNHAILPLCNERDRRTQVRWGVADFRHRFGREPESLWLPETACNDDTLETLIEEGLRFVILSPHQAERVRAQGATEWRTVADGSVDATVPYRFLHRDGSGRSIAVFFYDAQLAKAIAFDGALASSRGLLDRVEWAAKKEGALIINVATDGESYGHHYHFGDRCIAYALEVEAETRGIRVTNYGQFLEENPPTMEVELKRGAGGKGTAWSCAHGLGRWEADCGCNTGAPEGWDQKWRGPLRAALDLLRDSAAAHYEAAAGELLRDPWEARDSYVGLLVDPSRPRAGFFARHADAHLSEAEQVRALTLLELQRNSMLMYTSCGWFFNDISGLEAAQVLRYAGRTLDLMGELGFEPPEARFLEVLSCARSNVPDQGTGADIFRRSVEASRINTRRVAAHIAISDLAGEDEGAAVGEVAGYVYRRTDAQKQQHGRLTLSTALLALQQKQTGRRYRYALAAMHFGDVDYYCLLRPAAGDEDFPASTDKLWSRFRTASLPAMLRLAQEEFGPDEFSLEHVLPDGRQRISDIVFGGMVERFMEQYQFLYEENRRVIEVLQEAGFELPAELRAAAEFTMGRKFEKELLRQQQRQDFGDYRTALEIGDEAARLHYRIRREAVDRILEDTITRTVRYALVAPSLEYFQSALTLIELARKLGLEANIERAQEAVHETLQRGAVVSAEMSELALRLGLSPALLTPGHDDGRRERSPRGALEVSGAEATLT